MCKNYIIKENIKPKLTWVRQIQNKASCISIVLVTLIHGFFGKRQYAAIAPKRLTMKLSKVLCLECSTCDIFLSSSLTVSIMVRFLRRSLSESDINVPFILLFNLVISCMPLTNNLWKRFLHTRKGVLSTKLMPVHLPKSIFLINKANGMATSFPIPQSGYKTHISETSFLMFVNLLFLIMLEDQKSPEWNRLRITIISTLLMRLDLLRYLIFLISIIYFSCYNTNSL